MITTDNAIAHPCESWAKSAGVQSWTDAVHYMNTEHKLLVGQITAIQNTFKTSLGTQMFMEEAEKEGLHSYFQEDGQVALGRVQDYPPAILAQQEAAFSNFYKGLGQF